MWTNGDNITNGGTMRCVETVSARHRVAAKQPKVGGSLDEGPHGPLKADARLPVCLQRPSECSVTWGRGPSPHSRLVRETAVVRPVVGERRCRCRTVSSRSRVKRGFRTLANANLMSTPPSCPNITCMDLVALRKSPATGDELSGKVLRSGVWH
jgi:hypothetical protein